MAARPVADQLGLELRPPRPWLTPDPPARSPATSQDAARNARTFAGEQRGRVYAFLLARGARGATQREAEQQLGISRQALCPRFWELAGGNERHPWPVRIVVDGDRRREHCAVYTVVEGMHGTSADHQA